MTGLLLKIHHPDAIDDPYPVDDEQQLRAAILMEATTVGADAGSEQLDDPGAAARAELVARVRQDAAAVLTGAGTSYRDPLGILWTLEARS